MLDFVDRFLFSSALSIFPLNARVSRVAKDEGTHAAEVQRHVMVCRVCREEVLPEKWKRHVASVAHRNALRRNRKELRQAKK